MTDPSVLVVGEREPRYAHPGDAGADLTAAEAVELGPGERATIGTGVAIALPSGTVAPLAETLRTLLNRAAQ